MFAHFYFRFSPREELIDYHLQFLRRLRQRQYFVQFSSLLGDQLRLFYREFCSRYQDTVSMYREMIKDDRKFVALQCTMNPLQEERNSWVHFVCDSTPHQLSAIHRSAHQDGQGADGEISYTPASPRLRQGFIFSLLYLKRKWTMN